MLAIQNITESSLNLFAPTVFIESVEKLNDVDYRIIYSLQDTYTDGKFTWFDDQQVLNSIQVDLSLDGSVQKIPLSLIRKNYQYIKKTQLESNKTYTFYGEYILQNKLENAYLTASCGSDGVVGTKTIEPIVISGSMATSSYATSSYEYFNKNKDLTLLNINVGTASITDNSSSVASDLFVSYTTNKRALFGFIFDLKAYLEQNSSTYKKLSSYKNYSTEILTKSSILANSVVFFKTNKTLSNSSPEAILNKASIIKISPNEHKYLVTSFADSDTSYEYSLDVRLTVDDYADKIVDNSLVLNLNTCLLTVNRYKDLFEQVTKNNLINPNQYIYVNEWEKISSQLSEQIKRIAEITAFYRGDQTAEQTKKYVSLFTSMLHPLTTRVALISLFIEHLQTLLFYTQKLLSDTQLYNVSNLNSSKEYKNIYEKSFKDTISFDYKKGYGFEVISSNSMTVRMQERDTGIKELPAAELDLRRLLEANKYFTNPSRTTRESINTLSIASIDVGDSSYNLLTDIQATNVTLFNEVLYKVNEAVGFNFKYPRLESQYYQVSSDGITIDSVANIANTSVNNLQKSLLFDQNQDSRQSSLQTVTNTGINTLYLALDDNKYLPISSGSYHQSASANLNQGEGPKFVITQQVLDNPELKSKTILYYNTIFDIKNIEGGGSSNIQIYKLDSRDVSPILEDNLRIFNQYFFVRRTNAIPQSNEQVFNLENEINLGIQPRFLNRNTTKHQFIVGIESI